ncbi:MAG TPA: FAD-dependent oxidoreductase [Solirubrobacteraceae bacterium]|nr:FAD-dependent oxidoreductase [Solirubrobacteraceae bacterium]
MARETTHTAADEPVLGERTGNARSEPARDGVPERVETVIVGGGQAGLATGYQLTRRGRECVVLDADERIGDSWRRRWPTLRLYSPARLDELPGMRFPAPARSYPTAPEMADYLEAYAAELELPVRSGVAVDGLERSGERYLVSAGEQRWEADNVVVATGVFRDPHVPDFAADLDPRIRQLHSSEYRGPEQLQDGPVLVVGAAHSGADIAYEVAAGHETVLSGRHTGELPFRCDGPRARYLMPPVMRFVATRVLTVRTPMGRKARAKIRTSGGPLLRYRSPELRAAGVERVLERTVGVVDGMPVLAGGRVVEAANVIWCTGFRNDYGWIRFALPIGEDGFPEQDRGAVRGWPGLFFVGLLFLDSFSSMLILGARRDAERVAAQIASRPVGVAGA